MNMPECWIIEGDALTTLANLPSDHVHCCVTSPPYWGLRDYGVAGQLGLEKTPQEYVKSMVAVFREVRRVLRNDGTLWLNLGDSYATGSGGANPNSEKQSSNRGTNLLKPKKAYEDGILKPKDLVGIPWRLAFALQADGWWLRSDIIWCLSGGTWIYVKTAESGECLMTIKDLFRLDKSKFEIWTGEKWTRILGMSCSPRTGLEIELLLRSGERISCTPSHKWPTDRGLLEARELKSGDVLQTCKLPEPYPRPGHRLNTDYETAWFIGLYLAEGSRSDDTIQIAGHTKEEARWDRIQYLASTWGGSATRTIDGNSMNIRVYSRMLNAVLDDFLCGRTARDKGLSPKVWRMGNLFLEYVLRGYLDGDGHWEETNQRWRLGFCRNYNLERDLRTACARLGWTVCLRLATASCQGKRFKAFRGELRMARNGHHNERPASEIVEIRKARCRNVYDIGLAWEPHLFSLASGVLTHNSKPNPMPESVTDRPTKSHEYIFLLAKSERYYYDAEAIKENSIAGDNGSSFTDPRDFATKPGLGTKERKRNYAAANIPGQQAHGYTNRDDGLTSMAPCGRRNKRTVWTVPTSPYSEAHFATFPPDLIKPCIMAGCPVGGTVLDPFGGSGTTGQVSLELGRNAILIEINPAYVELASKRCNVTPAML